jgi:hypothetical protein
LCNGNAKPINKIQDPCCFALPMTMIKLNFCENNNFAVINFVFSEDKLSSQQDKNKPKKQKP